MQKYHDEPKQYKGYLKSALVSPVRQLPAVREPLQLEPPHLAWPAQLRSNAGLDFETDGADNLVVYVKLCNFRFMAEAVIR